MRDATYLDFPLSEYEERNRRLREEMEAANLDAVLLTTRENVEYLSGFTTPSWRLGQKRFWLLVTSTAPPSLFVDPVHEANAFETTPIEDIRIWGAGGVSNIQFLCDVLDKSDAGGGSLGLELGAASSIRITPGELDDLRAALRNTSFVDCDPIIGRIRMVKSPLEIERIRKAVEIAEAGFIAAFKSARAGMTERDLVNIVAARWRQQGDWTPYSGNNRGYLALQAGRMLQMTPSPVDRKIETGDLIQVDGGPAYRGYTACVYRNAIVGAEPTPEMQKYAEGASFVVNAVLNAVAPGVTSAELCTTARDITSEIGLENHRRQLTHAVDRASGISLGHGFGMSLEELPAIRSDDHTTLTPGMCGAIQISFGDDHIGYIEWEDDFLVTETGVEVLSKSPREIWVTG
ncbi:MAG: aminopeptidase P family protein [Chloroflexi bacterium]|nr:aminopeptidase P family protein [Chloroflexota bacterium]